jgi:hypothetical protein
MRIQLEMRPADGSTTPTAEISYRPRRMGRIVSTMAELHMVVDTGPPPKFPLWAVYGVSDFDSAGRPVGGRATDYVSALARILASHGRSDSPGIPLHKLRTNLGWHVTAGECVTAMRAYDAWRTDGNEEPGVFGPNLLPFLRAAGVGDGFEVH